MTTMRTFIVSMTIWLLPFAAWAGCGPPLPGKDQAGNVVNFETVVDAGGNCVPSVGLRDAATGAALFPTAAATADAFANPTTTSTMAMPMLWNGTNFDRLRGVNTGSAKTDLSSVAGTATVTGGVNGSLGVGGLAASGATGAGNPVKTGGIFNTTQPTVTNTQVVDAQMTARGAQIVATGVDAFTIQPGNTANTTPWLVQPVPGAASGCTPYHLPGGSAASTNSTSVKGSAGNLCDLVVVNTTLVIYYLKIYDSATAPTCSSATNIKHVYPIPNNSGTGGGIVRSLALGESYANGIGYCLTGGGGDTDNTNAAIGVFIEASYK